MIILLKALLVTLLADLVSGLVHWIEDVYFKPGMPIVHEIAVANDLHHHRPREFLNNSWWQSSRDLVLAALLIVLAATLMGACNWMVVLFAILVANANQMHKWSHQNRRENNRLILFLQKIKVLQTPRHHALHHSGEKNSHYCVITNILNPVLERINFWRTLESIVDLFLPRKYAASAH